MNLLVTGSRGQLGRELMNLAGLNSYTVMGVDLPQFDITDKNRFEPEFDRFKPSVVVNAAAYTNVDQAESDSEAAFLVNREGPILLSEYCARHHIPLVHISTDYVFDGQAGTPYQESDPISPLGVYGTSKAQGETGVRDTLNRHIIIRTSWLYSAHGHNFLNTMLRLGKTHKKIRVVADQYGSPTHARDLAESIMRILDHTLRQGRNSWGTYHYTGDGITTWHGFASAIFELARSFTELEVMNVRPITTAEYPTPARRPAFSALDCGLVQKTFNVRLRPWQSSLKKTITRIFTKNGA